MEVEFVTCPTCKQKLGVMNYVAVGTILVCANPECDTSLRVLGRGPLRVERVAKAETFKADYRPESYG